MSWGRPKAATFTVTEDHIKLLQHMYVGWQDCEFGAPEIDPKRPYGNSNVIPDIADILGIQPVEDEDGYEDFSDDEAYMNQVHAETETALQILLSTMQLTPGNYKWARVPGAPDKWEKI